MPIYRGKWVPRWKYDLLTSSDAAGEATKAEAAVAPARKPPVLRKAKELGPDAEG